MSLSIDFNQVNTDEQWVNALASIFDAALSANTEQVRSNLISLLGRFVQKSPTRLAALDDIAIGLQTDLAITNTDDRIRRIESRNSLLEQQAEAIGVEVTIANRDAGRLSRIKSEIDKATTAIRAIKQLADTIDSSAGTKAKFQSVLTNLDELAQTFRA